MWALENKTVFAAERTILRDGSGREVWVVAVKATFAVQPDGTCVPAGKQKPVLRAPLFAERDGAPLLLADADLGQPKPATDVIVHGSAHAPEGKPVPEMEVSMAVGSLRKSLLVTGDRRWEGRLRPTLSAPQPFVSMPLTYERAFGGLAPHSAPPVRDPRNPVGRGFVTQARHAFGELAPNIEHPGERLLRADQRPPPAGFGPIAPSWTPRVELAGTHDDVWLKQRHPLAPLDVHPEFYCCAPADQRIAGHLRGGEPVVLRHLTPEGVWAFDLPRVVLGFETHFEGAAPIQHRGTVSTVELRPDDQEVTMTLIAHVPCHRREHRLLGTVVRRKDVVPLGAPRQRGSR